MCLVGYVLLIACPRQPHSLQEYKDFHSDSFELGDRIIPPDIVFINPGYRVGDITRDSVRLIAEFLNRHPKLSVEISSHTDSRGSDSMNLALSEYRARTICNLLVESYGIHPDRIQGKGYGEAVPIVSKNEWDKATTKEAKEALHSKNRRFEMLVLSTE